MSSHYQLVCKRDPKKLRRRIPADDAWARYRQDVLGYPRGYDVWVMANLSAVESSGLGLLTVTEARCFVVGEYVPAPPTGTIFEDPGVYTLYIYAHISPELLINKHHRQSPRAILERYIGSHMEMEAPDWTQRADGSVREFHYDRGRLASLFVTLATHRNNLEKPGLSISMIEWAQAVAFGTEDSEAVDARIRRRGFGPLCSN